LKDNPSVVRFSRAHLARQAGYSDDTSVRTEEPDQICRSYFNQFYEAVQARQAVSECAGRGRQKDVEMLDG
jgi:hypothetical protein